MTEKTSFPEYLFPQKKKILLIGASGAVGMATRDMVAQYLGADVVTLDPPKETVHTEAELLARNKATQARRAERKETYKLYMAARDKTLPDQKDKTLDAKHTDWLLQGHTKLPESKFGQVTQIDVSKSRNEEAALMAGIKQGLDQGVDSIVVSAGVARKSKDEPRSKLIENNVPFFENLGKALGSYTIARLSENKNYHLPPLLNIGNPMDTMLEVTGRTVCAKLALEATRLMSIRDNEHYSEEKRKEASNLAIIISKELRRLKGTFIGVGGVLDSSRAAFAIGKETGIPPEDLRNVNVLGTHNPFMVADLENVRVAQKNGQELALKDCVDLNRILPKADEKGPDVTLGAKIKASTGAGGAAVIEDYRAITGKGQSAVFSTAAAAMLMLEPILTENNRSKQMPVAIYNIPDLALDKNASQQNMRGEFVQKLKKRPLFTEEKIVKDGVTETRMVKLPLSENGGIVMGRLVTLGADGVTEIFPPDPSIKAGLEKAAEDARTAMQATRFNPRIDKGM